MSNEEILYELGLRIDFARNVGIGWARTTLADVPPTLRAWAGDKLVEMMRGDETPAYVWIKTP